MGGAARRWTAATARQSARGGSRKQGRWRWRLPCSRGRGGARRVVDVARGARGQVESLAGVRSGGGWLWLRSRTLLQIALRQNEGAVRCAGSRQRCVREREVKGRSGSPGKRRRRINR